MILRAATIKYKGYDPIRHNLKTGKNMGAINLVALQFING